MADGRDDPIRKLMEEKIGELICIMNPYTHHMDIFVGNPNPDPHSVDFRQTEVEVDGNYPGTWAFKGEPQRINRSIRIKYRYPKKGQDGKTILCWLEDYLLIGYEGGGGA